MWRLNHPKDVFILDLALQNCCLTDSRILYVKNVFFVSNAASEFRNYDYWTLSSQLRQK